MDYDGCNKAFSEKDIYTVAGKSLCEDCAIEAGLYPLGHTGSRRDKISERGRRLTIPKRDDADKTEKNKPRVLASRIRGYARGHLPCEIPAKQGQLRCIS